MQELLVKQPETKKVVEVPKKWGMRNPQGNQVLQRKAETLINNVVKIQEKEGRVIDYLPHFQKYFDSYESSIINNTNCKEANQDSVKAAVWSFAREVSQEVEVSEACLTDLWNSRRSKVRKKTK